MEVKKTLEEVQIRHQELIKLEKSIMELKTLFVEMALMVEQQVRNDECDEYFRGKKNNDIIMLEKVYRGTYIVSRHTVRM